MLLVVCCTSQRIDVSSNSIMKTFQLLKVVLFLLIILYGTEDVISGKTPARSLAEPPANPPAKTSAKPPANQPARLPVRPNARSNTRQSGYISYQGFGYKDDP